MASNPYFESTVVLPSLQEMFPEHMSGPAFPYRQNQFGYPPPQHAQQPSFSYEVQRSYQDASYYENLSSHHPRAQTSSAGSASSDVDETESAVADYDFADTVGAANGRIDKDTGKKNHICSTCGKRFNRPSSLRIHSNTHTGAQPFRCSFPSCGRTFNVNSNMRRHFRSHTGGSPGATSTTPSKSTSVHPTSSPMPEPPVSPPFLVSSAPGIRGFNWAPPPEHASSSYYSPYGSPTYTPVSESESESHPSSSSYYVPQREMTAPHEHDVPYAYNSAPTPPAHALYDEHPYTWMPAQAASFTPEAVWDASVYESESRGRGGNGMAYAYASYSESDVRSQH